MRLVVNPDSADAWDAELSPGLYTLGRGSENSLAIDHPSVSSTHCELSLSDAGIRLKDLGSTNGTFLGGEIIEEAVIRPGQTFRLGDVPMRLEPAAVSEGEGVAPLGSVAATAGAAGRPGTAARSCKYHPRAAARYVCPQCQEPVCDLCVRTAFGGGPPVAYCRACGAQCERLAGPPGNPSTPRVSFARRAADAFQYPFNGDGAILFIGGALFYSLLDALSLLTGVAAIGIGILGTCYLVAYYKQILVTSAGGAATMPDWPDFSGFFSEILSPFLQLVATLLVSFLPALLLRVFARHQPWEPWAMVAAYLWGCAYFPMAFLAVAMFDSIVSANPLVVVPAIAKVPFQYLLTVLLLAVILGVQAVTEKFLPTLVPVPILPTVISSVLSLYLSVVELRILALLYLSNKERLGWFRR